jgi:hypothetical protein
MVSQTTSSKLTRLITFGCSLTYGHGLPDCFEPPLNPGPTQSKLGWPNIVSACKEMSLTNISQCGIGNRQIMHNILNFKFDKSDTVVILWTNPYRWCRIYEDHVEDIGTWQKTKIASVFTEYMSDEYDCLVSTSHNMHLADYHLKNIGINPIHIISSRTFFKDFTWNNISLENFDFKLREKYPPALDGKHPNLEAHQEFADLVIQSIDKRNLF